MGVALGVAEGAGASEEGVAELGVLSADGETGATLELAAGDDESGRGAVTGTGDLA